MLPRELMENNEHFKLSSVTDSDPTQDSGHNLAWKTSPTYAAAFRCSGAGCEDPCCSEWDIPVDRSTYETYQTFSSPELRLLVSQFVFKCAQGAPESLFARIYRGPSGSCPFLGTDHLCGIHKEYGPQLLSAACSIYPRALNRIAGELEGALSLSCPEAAKKVLLFPDFMQIKGDLFSGDFRTDNSFSLDSSESESGLIRKPQRDCRAFRGVLIAMVRDRPRPMGQRLLLIGSLCKQMDAIIEELEGALLLEEYRRIFATGAKSSEPEDTPGQPRLKLEVVFDLTNARVQEGSGRRFQDNFWMFVETLGTSDACLPRDEVQRFLEAKERYYRPFFEAFPFILENYLVNYIFQHLFPYGRSGSRSFVSQSVFEEYVQMTTLFAWIDALLVGVAGHHKEAFAGEHVVQAVQSFTRTIEHYPGVLQSIKEYMKTRGLNTLQGMAIMLKS